jgi:hypothetical protein
MTRQNVYQTYNTLHGFTLWLGSRGHRVFLIVVVVAARHGRVRLRHGGIVHAFGRGASTVGKRGEKHAEAHRQTFAGSVGICAWRGPVQREQRTLFVPDKDIGLLCPQAQAAIWSFDLHKILIVMTIDCPPTIGPGPNGADGRANATSIVD